MVDVSTTIVIARPRPIVSEFAASPDNATQWYQNIKAVDWLTPHPLVAGTRVRFVAEFLGRRLAYTYEMVDYVAGTLLRMRTTDGPFPMETTYSWSDASNDSTLMVLRNHGHPAGFVRVVTPFVALAMRRANVKDLAKLKTLLERRA